ncbi:MAG: hypothetical protein ABSF08_08035 [Candidatus Cybelea sp.]
MPGDGDLYWQRWLGELLLQTHRLPTVLGSETFTATGAPWVPQEWLFSLIVALAARHGLFLFFSILVSALPTAILWSVFARSRDTAWPAAIGVALFFCGWSFMQSFGVRAQVLGWALFAAFLFFLERRDRWYYAAIPTAILWANVHASVALAPGIVAARLAATALGGAGALRTSRDLLMFPAVLLAMICTPLGLRLPAYAIALSVSPIRHFIEEWQPAGFGDISFVLGALPLALAALLAGKVMLWEKRSELFPAALLFGATLFAARNIPLFAIAAAPLAAVGFSHQFPQLRRVRASLQEMQPLGLATIGIAIVLAGIAMTLLQRREPPRLPAAAIAALGADRVEHRLFCENFTWCSLALQYPSLRVFVDGRCDAYPVRIWQQYGTALKGGDSSNRVLRDYRVDAVVATRGGAIAQTLGKSGAWTIASQDRAYVAFRRE